MSINIKWAQKDHTVILPKSAESSLTASEVTDQLQWTDEQSLHLIVIGLKSSEGKEIQFTSVGGDSTFTHLSNWSEAITPGATYELLVNDVRAADVSKLTEGQKAEILKEFQTIDKDKSGEINLEEAKAYYNRKTTDHHERMDSLKKFRLEAASSDDEKKAIETKYEGFKSREKRFNDSRMSELIKKDTNGDGTISWQEFLVSEAPVYLIRSSLKSN